jgi:hypothetical protein
LEALRSLVGDGRVLQVRLRERGSRTLTVPGDLAVEIVHWEAKASAALVNRRRFLAEFRKVQREDAFTATLGSAYDRLELQLRVIEAAIEDLERRLRRSL